jgi:hypothetical protein
MISEFFCVLVLFNVIDVLATDYALTMGGHEVNPIIHWMIINLGGLVSVALMKGLLLMIVGLSLERIANSTVLKGAYYSITMVYLAVTVYHIVCMAVVMTT